MADAIFVVNDGLGIITNRLLDVGTVPKWIDWGVGITEASVMDWEIQSRVNCSEARTVGDATQQETNEPDDTYQVVGIMSCLVTGKTITEVGLFDALTDGTMFLHGTFTGIPVSVGDSIQFTLKVVFDQV